MLRNALNLAAALAAVGSTAAVPVSVLPREADGADAVGVSFGAHGAVIGPRGASDAAWGTFSNDIAATGWSTLEIHTSSDFSSTEQAYAAGFLEGAKTSELLVVHNHNVGATVSAKVLAFVKENDRWLHEQVDKYNTTDPFWFQVGLVHAQFDGLLDGHLSVCASSCLTAEQLLLLNLAGDLDAIQSAVDGVNYQSPLKGNGHCSGLVKLAADNSDVFMAHVTWDHFSAMTRIWKIYDFAFAKDASSSEIIPGRTTTESSYPGVINSGDDYYQTSAGLVIWETTIGNSNATLWQYVRPDKAPEWVRTITANRLATTPLEWAQIFAIDQSGSYNNEYAIFNFGAFTPGQAPPAGSFYVLDQVPGPNGYVMADRTQQLIDDGYFGSFNIPSFHDIWVLSGWEPLAKQYGDWFTYDGAPRAKIFARDQHKVTSLETMQAMMRYNDFEHDPLARCQCSPPYSGENAISARSDLNPANMTVPFSALAQRCHGGLDAKVTNKALNANLQSSIISGPTHVQQPVFVWSQSDACASTPHEGMADSWGHDWVTTKSAAQ